ncbi:MAG TPA: hypothetical protein VF145_11455 [Chitinophagaceae bacterium]
MIKELRQEFNNSFTWEKYSAYIEDLGKKHNRAQDFRVAETPVFVDRGFRDKVLSACESIIDVITQYNFKALTSRAIPSGLNVPGETGHSAFIAFDFGVCEGKDGLEPQLIEMQGFPSLFCYQVLQDEVIRRHFNIPLGYSMYLNGYNRESYLQLLKEIIVAGENPDQVILLEILPEQQKTRIDFYCTQEYLGIAVVCLTEIIQEGRKLYYLKNGVKTEIRRIYNRVIFDELQQQPAAIREKGKLFFEELDVSWVPHPNWFYRISKYTLPYIRDPYVPKTRFLSDQRDMPEDLEHYVLKPLFSFAGQGVVIDVKPEDIAAIEDPKNWILQKKVKYAEVIPTPGEPAKVEIRIFYFWKEGEPRPVAVGNLARLSKGKMIGVRYNKDKEWVGGSLAYFEKD